MVSEQILSMILSVLGCRLMTWCLILSYFEQLCENMHGEPRLQLHSYCTNARALIVQCGF